jgi:hypothetical protein
LGGPDSGFAFPGGSEGAFAFALWLDCGSTGFDAQANIPRNATNVMKEAEDLMGFTMTSLGKRAYVSDDSKN